MGANYTCQILTQNTFCNSTEICDCDTSNGLWNSSMCIFCPTNWQPFYNSCIIGSSDAVLFSSLDPSLIQKYCYNVSNSKVARMHVNNDMFISQFDSLVGFPQPYYFFDSYRLSNGSGYISSDGLYFLPWDSNYYLGSNTVENNCSMFQYDGRWWLASPCNVVQYFICELQLF